VKLTHPLQLDKIANLVRGIKRHGGQNDVASGEYYPERKDPEKTNLIMGSGDG
jgi:hypothetical protein